MSIFIGSQFSQRNYPWAAWKTVYAIKGSPLQYDDDGTLYTIWTYDGPEVLVCQVWKTTVPEGIADTSYSQAQNDSDRADFEANFKASGNKRIEIQTDSENAPIQRLKLAPTGWTYQLRSTEFSSSTLGSVVNNNCYGAPLMDASIKLYDANGLQITDQTLANTLCVRTDLDFEPSYSYEVIGGTIKFLPAITEDVRLSVIAVPDIPAAYGGSKIMVCNANLKFVDANNGIVADGRVSKRLDPSANHTNKLRIVIAHPPGFKAQFCLFIEHYKA